MQANLVNTGKVELLVVQNHTMNQNMVQGIKLHKFHSMGASGQPHAPVAWYFLHSAREIRWPALLSLSAIYSF
jgi:Na+(H+)/acetate symporter ActP